MREKFNIRSEVFLYWTSSCNPIFLRSFVHIETIFSRSFISKKWESSVQTWLKDCLKPPTTTAHIVLDTFDTFLREMRLLRRNLFPQPDHTHPTCYWHLPDWHNLWGEEDSCYIQVDLAWAWSVQWCSRLTVHQLNDRQLSLGCYWNHVPEQ